MLMNLNGIEGDVVILVRVAPYGKAEGRFMEDWKKIEKELKVTRSAVQLFDLFGWRNSAGEPYTQYELDFGTEKDLMDAMNWLDDYFYQMKILDEEVYNETSPEVVFVRKMKN